MNRVFLIVLLTGGLAACAYQERSGPPAPIIGGGRHQPAPQQTERAPAPSAEDTAEVYPYRPPSTAPDAAPPLGTVPAEEASSAEGGLITEHATPGPAGSAPSGAQSAPVSTGSPTGTASSSKPAREVVAYAPPPKPATSSVPPAAQALMKQAEQQRQGRDYVGAAATLERALGIQPQDPYIWNRLARVRMEQGLYAQAGNLASRSNALAGDHPALKQDNWRMIGAARRAVGDMAGAAEAEQKAGGG